MTIENIVKQINKGLQDKSSMKVGAVVSHPDGRKVKIIDGAYLRNGRVSNFWSWREVMSSNKLGDIEHGYGW